MNHKKFIFIILTTLFSGASLAGNAEDVTIVKLGTGDLYNSLCGAPCAPIKVSPAQQSFASCAQNTGSWDYALDTSTEQGKQAYSHLLAAHMSGKNISIFGKGTCIGSSGYEEINFLLSK